MARMINKYMIGLLVLTIIAGLVTGNARPAVGAALQPFIYAAVFVMLYPMMIEVNLQDIARAAREWKLILGALFLNFMVSPLTGSLVAGLFLGSYPDLASGLILIATVPCAGMIMTWTGKSAGNMPLVLVIMAVSLTSGIVLIPAWISVLAGRYIEVNAVEMLKIISVVLLVPLLLGNLTRVGLARLAGAGNVSDHHELLSAFAALGMLMVFFITMAMQAHNFIHHLEHLRVVVFPLVLLYASLLSMAVFCARVLNIRYADMVALTYGTTGKNISIALTLALLFFNPPTIMLIALVPLVQVSFLVLFYRLSFYLQRTWDAGSG